jgi:uncharacterized protein YacL
MKPTEFFKRWWQGIKSITPAQQLHAKIIGQWGNMIGLVFAWIFLWIKGFWYFSISMIFVLFILSIDLISINQQYKQACKMADEILELQKTMEETQNVQEKTD